MSKFHGTGSGFTNSNVVKRTRHLESLLGVHASIASDASLSGRLRIISKLRNARRTEIARGQSGSWLYDINRHIHLCAALRREYEALADTLWAEPPDDYRTQLATLQPSHTRNRNSTGTNPG